MKSEKKYSLDVLFPPEFANAIPPPDDRGFEQLVSSVSSPPPRFFYTQSDDQHSFWKEMVHSKSPSTEKIDSLVDNIAAVSEMVQKIETEKKQSSIRRFYQVKNEY